MMGLYRETGECLHILVRQSDGRLVDIGGARTRDEIAVREPSAELRAVNVGEIETLCRADGWAAAEPELARSWVPVVLERVDSGAGHLAAQCFRVVISRPDGLELMITWDGEIHLIAYVRDGAAPSTAWTRLAAIPTPRHEATGDFVIDFRAEAFEERSRLYVERHFDPDAAQRKLR
jgi:hypothetical protein